MQGVINCQLFTIQYADIHIIIIIQTIPAILGEGNRVIKIGILNKQKPGQYLGYWPDNAGRPYFYNKEFHRNQHL